MEQKNAELRERFSFGEPFTLDLIDPDPLSSLAEEALAADHEGPLPSWIKTGPTRDAS